MPNQKKYEYFLWDWSEIAPIAGIAKCAGKHPEWNVFMLYDEKYDADLLEVIMAASKEDAEAAVLNVYAQAIEEASMDPDDDWKPPKVKLWRDDE